VSVFILGLFALTVPARYVRVGFTLRFITRVSRLYGALSIRCALPLVVRLRIVDQFAPT
jgi:membrane-anchored protein YejM (alkaline phosphatase superfamily)